MTDRELLELLINRVKETRKYQEAFFARKMEYDKRMSIAAEKKLDALIVRLESKGYDGGKYNDKTAQGSLI